MPHPEELLISAVLRQEDVLAALAAGIDNRMFHSFKHEWKWIEQFYEKNSKSPTKAAFKAQFPDFTIYKTDDLDHFAQEVLKEHRSQVFMGVTADCMDLIEAGDIDAAVRRMHGAVMQIEASGTTAGEFNVFDDWEETYTDVMNRVTRVRERGSAGVPSGFPTLDQVTGGWQPGWTIIVGARLGQGKTWTMIKMAWAALIAGYNVSYFSLEQNRHQIAMRTHGFASKRYSEEQFQSLDLMRGTGFDLKKYKEFLSDVRNHVAGNFTVVDLTRGRVGTSTVSAHVEKVNPDIVFIDYLTLLDMKGSDHEAVGKVSAELKQVAEEREVPIVAASQINRTAIGKEPPDPESISRADSIGQDADAIVTLRQQSDHVMKLKLAKFRHGPDGITWFNEFRPGVGIYDEVSGDRAGEIMEQDREVD